MPVEHCVILAAGNGSRLRPISPTKPLTPVAGRTLLDRALAQARDAGCTRAVVIVGHGADEVRKHLQREDPGLEVRVVVNPRYQEPNGVSLLAAEPHVGERFYVLMADHVFDRPVLLELLAARAAPDGSCRLLVDEAPHWFCDLDATKVMARGNRALAIGKGLKDWNRIDAGAFLMERVVFDALREAGNVAPPSVTDAMQRLIAAERLEVVAVAGVRWVDIDTPEDLRAAERLLHDIASLT